MKGRFKSGKIFIPLVIIILISSIFISYPLGKQNYLNLVGTIIVKPLRPILSFFTKISEFIKFSYIRYFHLVDVEKENELLKMSVNSLQSMVDYYLSLEEENTRLKELLNLLPEYPRTVAARIIAIDEAGSAQSVVINKGKEAGIRKNCGVVNQKGVVGQVVRAYDHISVVELLTSNICGISGYVKKDENSYRGIVKGKGNFTCEIKFLLSKAEVEVDDVVFTTGLGGIFPKGIRIGTIYSVIRDEHQLFQEVLVKPAIDIQSLDFVLIFLPEEQNYEQN